MSATYDPTLPTDKDHVRFLIGDIDITSPQYQDEEIIAITQEVPASGKAIKYYAAAYILSALVTASVTSGHGVMDIRLSSLAINLGMAGAGISAIQDRITWLQQRGQYVQAGSTPVIRGMGARNVWPGYYRW